jgi:hypothetical protein
MKLTSTQPLKLLMATGITFCILSGQTAKAESKPFINLTAVKEEAKNPAKKKSKTKKFSSRNNNSVKIYPDFIKRDMHVMAKDNNKEVLDFFVFDMQVTLVHHYKMQPKDHQCLKDFKKGKYIFRVFNGDEETAAGHIEFR